ncbi:hypothetical protein LDFHOB_07515 [Candidatus Electronema aureum]
MNRFILLKQQGAAAPSTEINWADSPARASEES